MYIHLFVCTDTCSGADSDIRAEIHLQIQEQIVRQTQEQYRTLGQLISIICA